MLVYMADQQNTVKAVQITLKSNIIVTRDERSTNVLEFTMYMYVRVWIGLKTNVQQNNQNPYHINQMGKD